MRLCRDASRQRTMRPPGALQSLKLSQPAGYNPDCSIFATVTAVRMTL